MPQLHIERIQRWSVVISVAALLYGLGNLYQPTVVVGESMSPTLESGRVIWMDRTWYRNHPPRPGEVVVFRQDGHTYVKRIYRGPGDVIHYVACGRDWLGPVRYNRLREVRETYESYRTVMSVKKLQIPKNSVFVLGDNYLRSIDSRELGPIPMENIIGRAYLDVDTTKALPFECVGRNQHARSRSAQVAWAL